MNCSKVRHYSKDYIHELVQNGVTLTINQNIIYRTYHQQEHRESNFRIPFTYFPNK